MTHDSLSPLLGSQAALSPGNSAPQGRKGADADFAEVWQKSIPSDAKEAASGTKPEIGSQATPDSEHMDEEALLEEAFSEIEETPVPKEEIEGSAPPPPRQTAPIVKSDAIVAMAQPMGRLQQANAETEIAARSSSIDAVSVAKSGVGLEISDVSDPPQNITATSVSSGGHLNASSALPGSAQQGAPLNNPQVSTSALHGLPEVQQNAASHELSEVQPSAAKGHPRPEQHTPGTNIVSNGMILPATTKAGNTPTALSSRNKPLDSPPPSDMTEPVGDTIERVGLRGPSDQRQTLVPTSNTPLQYMPETSSIVATAKSLQVQKEGLQNVDPDVAATSSLHDLNNHSLSSQTRATPVAGPYPSIGPAVSSPRLDQQLTSQITTAIRPLRPGTTEIALSPPELGRVKITVSNHESGMLVSVSTERQDTLDLLRRNVDSLNQELRASSDDEIAFAFSHSGAEAGSRGEPESDNNNSTAQRVHNMDDSVHVIASPTRHILSTSLDLRI